MKRFITDKNCLIFDDAKQKKVVSMEKINRPDTGVFSVMLVDFDNFSNKVKMHDRFFHIPTTEQGLKFFNTNKVISIGSDFNPRYHDLLEYSPPKPWLKYPENPMPFLWYALIIP